MISSLESSVGAAQSLPALWRLSPFCLWVFCCYVLFLFLFFVLFLFFNQALSGN